MAYLVTGGGGFIGSHIVEYLAKEGKETRVLDNFSTGRRTNLRGFSVDIIEGDIRDTECVQRSVKGVDTVFHQAVLCSVVRSVEDPVTTHDVNTTGTVLLLEACRRAGVRRVVFASSSAVYGESEMLPKREDMGTEPVSPYAVSKLEGELYCQMFYKVYGLETACLRYFNVFGPRQDPNSDYAAVIPRFIESATNGDRPIIYGDGTQTRDFIYVENVVRANLAAATSPRASGKVMNVACGERRSLIELVQSLEKTLDRDDLTPILREPRAGDVKHSQASIDLCSRLLGISPVVAFDEGLERTVGWFRNSPRSRAVGRVNGGRH
jgi:UDP-glucose 4-epimerase